MRHGGDALLEVNLLLLIVNLLPILPLDGGRIVRSAIVKRLGPAAGGGRLLRLMDKATWGLLCVVALLCVLGVLSVNAVVLAVFLLYAVAEEKKMMPYLFMGYLGSKQGELSVTGALAGRVIVVLPDTLVARVLKDMTPGCYHLFQIVQANGQVIPVTEESLFAALVSQGLGITFADVNTPLETFAP
ncbi:MAG: Stage IV sporulation protein FB [Firmicutes bacterium]|nr:Stage IV sporulation protein FB [Bacillota bacterium]